jgi:hypothetical protein
MSLEADWSLMVPINAVAFNETRLAPGADRLERGVPPRRYVGSSSRHRRRKPSNPRGILAPGVVSLRAELRARERQAAERSRQWKTCVEEPKPLEVPTPVWWPEFSKGWSRCRSAWSRSQWNCLTSVPGRPDKIGVQEWPLGRCSS